MQPNILNMKAFQQYDSAKNENVGQVKTLKQLIEYDLEDESIRSHVPEFNQTTLKDHIFKLGVNRSKKKVSID